MKSSVSGWGCLFDLGMLPFHMVRILLTNVTVDDYPKVGDHVGRVRAVLGSPDKVTRRQTKAGETVTLHYKRRDTLAHDLSVVTKDDMVTEVRMKGRT